MTFLKRLLRGPLIYILVAIAAVWIGSSLLSASGFQQITTDEGLTFLKNKAVSEATIVDVENRVDLTLTNADVKYGDKVQFFFVNARGTDVVNAVNEAAPSDGFNDEVPHDNWLLSTLGFLLPILLIGVFFWWML